MKVLTHAHDCEARNAPADPLLCDCAGVFQTFRNLDDVLAAGHTFDCPECGKLIDDTYDFEDEEGDKMSPQVELSCVEEIQLVFCCWFCLDRYERRYVGC